jgi:hypothetical protein
MRTYVPYYSTNYRKGRCFMEVWNGVRVYDEPGFERKVRREGKQILWEEITAGTVDPGDLLRGQLGDLIGGLPLPPRSKDLLRLRLEGWTLRESAQRMGVSRQRVERIWARTLRRLPPTLEAMEAAMERLPHYGWQEVFLDSQR